MVLDGFEDVSGILRCGVYALVAKGEVLYVGKSKSLYSRIYTHRNNWVRRRQGKQVPDWLPGSVKGIMFDEVHVRVCPAHELDALEREMIDKYRPKINVRLQVQGAIKAPISVVIGRLILEINKVPMERLRRI